MKIKLLCKNIYPIWTRARGTIFLSILIVFLNKTTPEGKIGKKKRPTPLYADLLFQCFQKYFTRPAADKGFVISTKSGKIRSVLTVTEE